MYRTQPRRAGPRKRSRARLVQLRTYCTGPVPLNALWLRPGACHRRSALGLRKIDVPVVCIDARQAHQSLKAMKANKADPHDAAGLAQLARTGFYKEVHVKSPAAHGVRSVITARGHLVEARVRPPRCHHACHAARWYFVRGLRSGRTSSPAVMLPS